MAAKVQPLLNVSHIKFARTGESSVASVANRAPNAPAVNAPANVPAPAPVPAPVPNVPEPKPEPPDLIFDLGQIGIGGVVESSQSYDINLLNGNNSRKPGGLWSHVQVCDDSGLRIVDTAGHGLNKDMALVAGSLLLVNGTVFTVVRHIKSGSYGCVAVVRGFNGRQFILKRINCYRQTIDEIYRHQRLAANEVFLQFVVSQTGLCPKIMTTARNRMNLVLYVIMEFIEGGDTETLFLSQPTVDDRWYAFNRTMRALADIVKELYTRFKFNHCDMKFDNFFYSPPLNKFFLIDFGFVTMCLDGDDRSFISNNTWGPRYHPTNDLTMMAASVDWFIDKDARADPRFVMALDKLLLNAQCDTTVPKRAGNLVPHDPHILPEADGKRLLTGVRWKTIYPRMQTCNNVLCLPAAVYAALDAADALVPVAGGGRRRRRIRRTRRRVSPRWKN